MEYNPKQYNVYRPSTNSYPDFGEELEEVIKWVEKRQGKIDMLVIDEANRAWPSRKELPENAMRMTDFQRHWGLCVVTVARRPVTLNTNMIELANHQIVYVLTGKNDMDYLNSLKRGLGDVVENLPEYHYAVRSGTNVIVCSPVDKLD